MPLQFDSAIDVNWSYVFKHRGYAQTSTMFAYPPGESL